MKRFTQISCWTALGLALLLITGASKAVAVPPAITNLVLVPSLTIESDLGVTNQIRFSTALATNDCTVLTNVLVTDSPYRFIDLSAPAAAVTLTVAGLRSPWKTGVAGTFTVVLRDAFGNVATGYKGTLAFSSSDPAATLPANTTFTPANAGAHSFSATLRTLGIQSITAKDAVTAAITGSQAAIAVLP